MKKLMILLSFMLGSSVFAQDAMNYQAVIRDASGNLLINNSVDIKFSILQSSSSGVVSYSETHSVNTNDFGLVNVEIGNGTVVNGAFANIEWGVYKHFLKVEVDLGSGYVFMGTTQLNYVPYAIFASKAEYAVNDSDNQQLSLSGNSLSISGGNAVTLPASNIGDITEVTAGIGITGGGTTGAVTLNAQTTTALWNANKLKGKTVSSTSPTNGQVLKWSGSAWAPATDLGTTYTMGNGLSLSGNTINSSWTKSGSNIYSNNTGNVGIGTSSPSTPLHINAGSGVDPLRIQIAGTTKFMVHDNGGVGIGYSTSYPPTNGLLLGGDLGIGLTSPQDRIHVTSATSSGASAMRFTRGTTGITSTDGFWIGYSNNGSNYLWGYENNNLIIGTNSTIRVVIQSDGDVGIGTTNPSFDLQLAYNSAAKPGSPYWSVISDSRLKNEEGAFTDGLDLVMKIRPITFKYNGKLGLPTDEIGVGTMAQELQKIAPYMVKPFVYKEDGSTSGPDEAIEASGETHEYLAVDYGAMDFVLVNAVQELKTMIDDQQKLIVELQEKIEKLEKKSNKK